ncbi:sodium-dependent phosphate transport protein 2B-like [Lytechinus variegatus]|uniref:sodium-dependent phosphate transport protein 2B-like n=1 Tax=Lytechinus variegatus TaxID=7654 RepID=UPI001BB2767C|nr:sodium-dependent phosphate transport protein 2B-like [Lytechinus variegatus]
MESHPRTSAEEGIFAIFSGHGGGGDEIGNVNPVYQGDVIHLQPRTSLSQFSTIALDDLETFQKARLELSGVILSGFEVDDDDDDDNESDEEHNKGDRENISIVDEHRVSDTADAEESTNKDKPTYKFIAILRAFLKWIFLLGFLYIFICCLDILSLGFSLLGGKGIGVVVANNDLLTNPLCGLMIGLLSTVLVQSSSTTTSVVVSMVSAHVVSVKHAIPIIMGTNIGSAVTNTLVSFSQVRDKDEFRRAFGGAAVHDIFNCLTVAVLLPVEMATSYLEVMTGAIIETFDFSDTNTSVEFLKVITSPCTDVIVQVRSVNVDDIDLLLRENTTGGQSIIRKCIDVPRNSCKSI